SGSHRIVSGNWRAAGDVLRVGRSARHEMPRAAIVDPNRRPVGAEEAIGAVAENIEARAKVQRRREAFSELFHQLTDVALQLLALAKPEQLERGQECVGT